LWGQLYCKSKGGTTRDGSGAILDTAPLSRYNSLACLLKARPSQRTDNSEQYGETQGYGEPGNKAKSHP
jgi:hypothetical protein